MRPSKTTVGFGLLLVLRSEVLIEIFLRVDHAAVLFAELLGLGQQTILNRIQFIDKALNKGVLGNPLD